MAQFFVKHPITGIPADKLPELRKSMAHHVGGQVIELMLNDGNYITGATINVESEIIFEGASDTMMGEPFLQIKINLDHRGNDYLHQKKPVKELQS